MSSADRKALDTFAAANRSAMASDLDGAPVFMAQSQFSLAYALERAPEISASDIKAVGKGEGYSPCPPATGVGDDGRSRRVGSLDR